MKKTKSKNKTITRTVANLETAVGITEVAIAFSQVLAADDTFRAAQQRYEKAVAKHNEAHKFYDELELSTVRYKKVKYFLMSNIMSGTPALTIGLSGQLLNPAPAVHILLGKWSANGGCEWNLRLYSKEGPIVHYSIPGKIEDVVAAGIRIMAGEWSAVQKAHKKAIVQSAPLSEAAKRAIAAAPKGNPVEEP